MPFDEFSVPELVDLCKQSMRQYRRRLPNDPRYCFELFRRALRDGVEDALRETMLITEAFALNTVYKHTGLNETGETAEYFASEAARRLYRYGRGEQFDKFATYADILAYINRCAATAIGEMLRPRRAKKPRWNQRYGGESSPETDVSGTQAPRTPIPPVIPTVGLDDDPPSDDTSGDILDVVAVWDRVCALLPNENDQMLVRAMWEDLPPRHIAELYPGRWDDAVAVSRALARVRGILRADPVLQQWAGMGERN